MPWVPISEPELLQSLKEARERMDAPQRRLWDLIRIVPQKWQSSPYGDQGDGFWVVALLGQTVIWFNDIEEGFNCSRWIQFGQIDEYWCNQDQLEWTVQELLDTMQTGQANRPKFDPPEPIT
jgi:hypothetical protein